MTNLIIVSGPQAVGKMTVAEKLRDKTGYRLMTNHDSIELSDVIFERTSDAQKEFNLLILKAAFETAIKYDIDMIFTFVMAYDEEKDLAYINYLKALFESTGGKFYFVELRASLETRLKRNTTPHRLEMKPTKRDTEWSRNDILKTMNKYRLNSYDDEYLCENHLKINNDDLLPEEVADIIVKKFDLTEDKKKVKL